MKLTPSGDYIVATATATPSKTSFVEKFLNNNPQSNVKAVNEAWTAAGMKGTIGSTLIQKMRSEMGLVGNLSTTSKPKTAARAATANKTSKTASTPNKTSFVKEFLQKNPQGNTRTANEAWTSAGMKGTISHTVISEVRKQIGLIGSQPGKPTTAAKAKSATKTSKPPVNPGKTMFVKEFLIDQPQGNLAAVNEAWQAAGFSGTIGATLVNQLRSSLGLAGNLRGVTQTAVMGRPGKETAATVNVQPRSNGSMVLNDLEAEIDRLMFKVMGVGDLTEIEDTLRGAEGCSTQR